MIFFEGFTGVVLAGNGFVSCLEGFVFSSLNILNHYCPVKILFFLLVLKPHGLLLFFYSKKK